MTSPETYILQFIKQESHVPYKVIYGHNYSFLIQETSLEFRCRMWSQCRMSPQWRHYIKENVKIVTIFIFIHPVYKNTQIFYPVKFFYLKLEINLNIYSKSESNSVGYIPLHLMLQIYTYRKYLHLHRDKIVIYEV